MSENSIPVEQLATFKILHPAAPGPKNQEPDAPKRPDRESSSTRSTVEPPTAKPKLHLRPRNSEEQPRNTRLREGYGGQALNTRNRSSGTTYPPSPSVRLADAPEPSAQKKPLNTAEREELARALKFLGALRASSQAVGGTE